MATILRQSLKSVASKAINNSLKVSAVGAQNVKFTGEIAARGVTLNSGRGMHCIAASNARNTQFTGQSKFCSCRKFHTKGDENMAEFLDKEITHEKDNPPPKASAISGWTTATDGTVVTLSKTFKDESVSVEFDVTSSVEGDLDEQLYQADAAAEDAQVMISRPPFTVEIKKKSGKCLKMECEFTPPEPTFEEGQEPPKDENMEDQFSIIDVSLAEAGQTDNFFVLSGGIMDEVMYDLLMEMLDERGIDDDFVTALVKYSTSYEQSLYVKFLQSLKTFVDEK